MQDNPDALIVDPEFKSLCPPLSSDELSQLEENIIADGCRDPLVVWSGHNVLIDGHNRHEICERLGIKYQVEFIECADRDAAMLKMIDIQRGRRNISSIDKVRLQAVRERIVSAKAKENQRRHGGTAPGRKKNTSGKIAKSEPVNTRAECAAAAGVGERTYADGKLILDAEAGGEIDAETVDKVRRHKTSIHKVAKEIRDNRKKSDREAKRKAAVQAKPLPMDSRIIVGDFRDHADKIADGSVNLIFTDPPYDRKASKVLSELGEFAESKLAEGGSLVCYVGQTQIPSALDAFRKYLRYWWTIACIHSGRSTVMREYGINAGWKAVLWFVKQTRDDVNVMVNDTMSGGEEKQAHDWQQAQGEAEYWIEKLCPSDGIVCDPYLGGGTTAAAAKQLNREWIGFEIDPDTANNANARIGA